MPGPDRLGPLAGDSGGRVARTEGIREAIIPRAYAPRDREGGGGVHTEGIREAIIPASWIAPLCMVDHWPAAKHKTNKRTRCVLKRARTHFIMH